MKTTKKTETRFGTLLGMGIATLAMASPLLANAASNSVECTPPVGAKSPALNWYAVGRDLAADGYLNLAYFSMDRAIRDTSGSTVTTAAALACLSKIEAKNPILDLPNYGSTISALLERTKPGSAERQSVETFAFRGLVQAITNGSSLKTYQKSAVLSNYAKVFSTPGAYHSTAEALLAIARLPAGDGKVTTTIRTALNEIENGSVPSEAKELRPLLRLSLARNLYASGASASAISEYERLFAIGQPMQDALIESAWAQLRSKNYVKSIGLGYELSTGKLSEFFAPEALSIRAISFVENCRYPEARQTALKFLSEYRALQSWLKSADANGSLYELAVAKSEGTIGKESVPEKVWSLWSSSNLFMNAQNAIQKSFREEREVKEWISDRVENPEMKSALFVDVAKLPKVRTRAANRIEKHLQALNRSMLVRIANENERLRFVSIEANQGAGRDLIYRNANPGMNEVEKDLEKSERKAKSYSGKLAWGKAKKDDPKAEMWIDEIGAYEAQTLNRCGVKAKYQELRASL